MLYATEGSHRRNLMVLLRILLAFIALVAVFSVIFHLLMAWEGQDHSWMTGVYWTLVVMSTLGFGDITFTSDLGRLFSVLVLISGTMFLLILLPFTFIQFFYAPWLEAQAAARAPRSLPPETARHVVLTSYGPVEAALIRRLDQFQYDYVVLVPDVAEALKLSDRGTRVMVGDIDDPETYRRARVAEAALVAAGRADTVNSNIAFTVREISEHVPIIATADSPTSVDVLELAGCHRVLQLSEMLGQLFARRVIGRDAKSHVIGHFDELLIAEATAANTPLVGRTIRQINLREHANVSIIGVWQRGRFELPDPDTPITANTVLVLAGSREQLDAYDALFCIYNYSPAPVVILGGGRVGSAAARALESQGIDYRIVEQRPELAANPDRYVVGDADEIEVLERAGIAKSSTVVVTTHDDDVNVYLTIYCRRLRPDIQILSRATLERNISTLHRAGADVVLSYASLGANAIFNLLKRSDVLFVAEGLDVIKVPVPPALHGKSIREEDIRHETGCSIVAIRRNGQIEVNPSPDATLPAGGELILIGDADAHDRFLRRYVNV
jgi:Trk K+ transport system NAD-binding subunit